MYFIDKVLKVASVALGCYNDYPFLFKCLFTGCSLCSYSWFQRHSAPSLQTYLYLFCANHFYYKPYILIEQAACHAHTISVQHHLEMHMYMHESIGHDQCKQCKPWWQILIINIVLIVQYAMDNSAKPFQSLP